MIDAKKTDFGKLVGAENHTLVDYKCLAIKDKSVNLLKSKG